MSTPKAQELAAAMSAPPVATSLKEPDAAQLLFDTEEPPPFPEMNIFPLEWRVETPKLQQIYDAARMPGWSPHTLPWDTLDPAAFSLDERYALAYWFTLLSVFDGSGPAVFSRAFIHTWETHEEDPIRKCFFSIVRDEVNHEEVCQRAIQTLTPNGPLNYEPETPLGQLARNNIKWYYHNGCRYWNGFKNGITKFQLPILFSSFLMGEVASATLFHSMYQRTTIPAFKEAFKQVGKDEARHMAVCLAVLRNVLPHLTDEQRQVITKQIRAGFVFLSGILYLPPEEFWELGPTFHPAHRMLEATAREAGLGILTEAERAENWRSAVLRLKGVLEPYGVEFPALPEIGIDGKTVAFDPDDIIPVF
jgi:rubrerythrin